MLRYLSRWRAARRYRVGKHGAVKPLVHPPTDDPGRFAVTHDENDRFVFKVPSLRNVAQTGPWFHDGEATRLEHAVTKMADHQLGVTLGAADLADLVAFLGALQGSIDPALARSPALP